MYLWEKELDLERLMFEKRSGFIDINFLISSHECHIVGAGFSINQRAFLSYSLS